MRVEQDDGNTRRGTPCALRSWAEGSLSMEAAVELLLRAFGGRFGQSGMPWVRAEDDGHAWLDADALRSGTGPLSGGERRLLSVVAALIDDGPLDIVDVVSGLDRQNLRLVLAALSHAGGAHQASDLAIGRDGVATLHRGAPIVPWPAQEPTL